MIRYRKKSAQAFFSVSCEIRGISYIEPGDIIVDIDGRMFRCEKSSSWCKRNTGELYPRRIKPPKPGMKATIIDGEAYWIEADAGKGKQA